MASVYEFPMRSILVLLSILSLAACDADSHTLYVDARQAFARHDYKAARLHLIEALKVDPGNRDVLLLQARTLVELGDGEGAAASIQRLTGGKPPQGELAELAASAALLRRNPAVVFDLLGSAHNAEAERLKATAALQQKDLDKAIAHLDRAIAAGGNARTYADFARVWLIRGDLSRAETMAREAQRRGPDDFGTLLISGELASLKGDLASALGFYDKADRLFPGNIAVLSGKAGVLGDLRRFDALERTLSQLVELAPRDPDVTYLRVRLAQAHKDWKGIKALVQPLEAGLERQSPIRLVYAEALLNLGEAEQAIAQSIGIARSQPDNRKAAMILAAAQFAAGDARGAMETLGPVAHSPQARSEELALMARITASLNDPSSVNYRLAARNPSPKALAADLAEGDSAMRAGDWARARIAYDRILAVTDGRNAMVLNNLAYAQSMLGHHAEALKLADRALKLAPGDGSVLDTAGWVRLRAGGSRTEAVRLLRMAAARSPGNATIRSHLAEAERSPN